MGSVMDAAATPSVVLVAYVELLRTLVTRLESDSDNVPATAAASAGLSRAPAVAAAAAAGGGCGEDARAVPGAWAGVRALDLETLFR